MTMKLPSRSRLAAASLLTAAALLPGATLAADRPGPGRRLGRAGAGHAGPVTSERSPGGDAETATDGGGYTATDGNVLSIVKLRSTRTAGAAAEGALASPTDVSNKCTGAALAVGGSVVDVFSSLSSCVLSTPPSSLMALAALSMVQDASPDEPVHLPEPDELLKTHSHLNDPYGKHQHQSRRDLAEETVPSWGLDRVDQCIGQDGVRTKAEADGVRVYVLDTGVRTTHNDLAAYVNPDSDCHFHAPSLGEDDWMDGHGHGTHVAGTVLGTLYGVAQDAELCAVKVLSASGGGSLATVLAGLNHVKEQCADRRCVVNMSLGGGSASPGTAYYDAHKELTDMGVVLVVAAGNGNSDVCGAPGNGAGGSMPAAHPDCLTVGATRETPADARAGFSDYGHCVDVYAPGQDILSAGIANDQATDEMSGTSMACPHVAGIAAHAMSELGDAWTADRDGAEAVKDQVLGDAFSTGTHWPEGSANEIKIANTEGACATPPPTPAPTPCLGGTNGRVDVHTDSYPAETSWTVTNDCGGGAVVHAGGPYDDAGTDHTAELCVPAGSQYTFTISDLFGDGMCCSYGEGSYSLTVDEEELLAGGEFSTPESVSWGSCDDLASPTPSSSPPLTTSVPSSSISAPPSSGTTSVPSSSISAPPSSGDNPDPDPDPDDLPEPIIVSHVQAFHFVPQSACSSFDVAAAAPFGTLPGQCAQACAVLLDCDGFEVFRADHGAHDEGDCVLARLDGDPQDAPDCDHRVWYYARNVQADGA